MSVHVCESICACGHLCMFSTTYMLKGFQAASIILYMEWFLDLGKFPELQSNHPSEHEETDQGRNGDSGPESPTGVRAQHLHRSCSFITKSRFHQGLESQAQQIEGRRRGEVGPSAASQEGVRQEEQGGGRGLWEEQSGPVGVLTPLASPSARSGQKYKPYDLISCN